MAFTLQLHPYGWELKWQPVDHRCNALTTILPSHLFVVHRVYG